MKESILKPMVITLGLTLPSNALAGPIMPFLPKAPESADADHLVWLAHCHDDSPYDDGGSGNDEGSGNDGGSGNDTMGGGGGPGGCADDAPSPGGALNSGVTKKLVDIINDANGTCGNPAMSDQYRVDCLRIYYGWVADQLPDTGDYAPIKKIMRDAEAKLDRIVTANLESGLPTITPREEYKPATKRMPPIRAVKKSATDSVIKQAEDVVKETELLIIRSGGDPERRAPHYNAVADAVDDNLVILRSA